MNTASSKKSLITLGVELVYGVTIGLASIMLLATLLVAFCDKSKCRYLMYFSCFLLFFVGLLGFILAIFFSIIAPTVYFGCQFIDFSLSSTTNFNCTFVII
jgi:predicted tellurium resistance membrane protein TerC